MCAFICAKVLLKLFIDFIVIYTDCITVKLFLGLGMVLKSPIRLGVMNQLMLTGQHRQKSFTKSVHSTTVSCACASLLPCAAISSQMHHGIFRKSSYSHMSPSARPTNVPSQIRSDKMLRPVICLDDGNFSYCLSFIQCKCVNFHYVVVSLPKRKLEDAIFVSSSSDRKVKETVVG